MSDKNTPAQAKPTTVHGYKFKDGSKVKGHPGIFRDKPIAVEDLSETMIKALKVEDARFAKAGKPLNFMDLIEKA